MRTIGYTAGICGDRPAMIATPYDTAKPRRNYIMGCRTRNGPLLPRSRQRNQARGRPPLMSTTQPALFLDRDGVINRRIVDGYVTRWDTFEFLPDIFDVLPLAHAAGMFVVVVTNQRGIARGLMTEEDLLDIHQRMQDELHARTGHRIDAIYWCPHSGEQACRCRKPAPGMLIDAARDHGLALPASWLVGDSESDIEAGIAAGCRTVRVAPAGTATRALLTAESLLAGWQALAPMPGGNNPTNAVQAEGDKRSHPGQRT